jgi:carbamate kinase
MQGKSETIIIALGGNALLNSKSKGTIEEREEASDLTARQLFDILSSEHRVILTHGNGPQVGNLLIQNDEASKKVPPMPLDVCVAETQGEIGFILQKSIKNVFDTKKFDKPIATILTEVEVDENDPAFKKLTKPVGPYYTKEQVNEILSSKNWTFAEDPAGKGFRRVVASPRPMRIMQTKLISSLSALGYLVISVGGGGIPVYYNHQKNEFRGMEAVIDKDLASSRLAIDMLADKLIILTNVDNCYINYKKPNQITLTDLNLDEATTYFEQGHFTAGSMGPKVQAAIEFVQSTGNTAIISSIEKLNDAIEGKAGTIFHP